MVDRNKNRFSISTAAINGICRGMSALILTHSGSFDWMGDRLSYEWSGDQCIVSVKVSPFYQSNPSLEADAKEKIKSIVSAAEAKARPSYYAYDIIQYFDQWLCAKNYYNMYGTKEENRDTAEYYYCHSAYGTLLKGYGVCESYAKAMSRLLDAAGITNMYVVSYAHAFVYVYMPDGQWYLQDTTWNDTTNPGDVNSNRRYLLAADSKDPSHQPVGTIYSSQGGKFTFPALSSVKYQPMVENLAAVEMKDETIVLPVKGTKNCGGMTGYYKDFSQYWQSDNPAVARVDSRGKITAVSVGHAKITCSVMGKTYTKDTYVYQFNGIAFAKNGKNKLTQTFENEKSDFAGSSDPCELNVLQSGASGMSAQAITQNADLAEPIAKSSKPAVAEVRSVALEGDRIRLEVAPKAVGTTVISVKFAGKSASLTYKVTQKLLDAWFQQLPYSSVEYNGKAQKPKVLKTDDAPTKVTYSVKYSENLNAGTATVTITGTNSYSGTVTRTFQIKPRSIADANFKCSASAVYKAGENPLKATLKVGGKTLKAGRDYEIRYSGSSSVPTDCGTYAISIHGINNYANARSNVATYTIKPAALLAVTFTCPKTLRYTGTSVIPNYSVKIGKNTVPESEYSITYYNASGDAVSAPNAKGTYRVVLTTTDRNIATTLRSTSLTRKLTVK